MVPRSFRPLARLALFAFALPAAASPVVAFAQQGATAADAPPLDAPRAPAQTTPVTDDAHLEALTFDAAVQRAVERNPTTKEAIEEVRRFHALMEEVRAASLPTLNAIGTYTRLDHDRVENGVLVDPKGSVNGNVTLAAPLIYPHGWVQWGQAGDQVDIAKANALEVRRTIAVSTARAYLSVITQRLLVATAITARDNAKAHYEFTRAQRMGGVGNRLDEIRAAQEFTSDEVNVQTQSIALLRAREALGVFVATNGPVDAADTWTPATMPAFNDAMNDAEKLRPDVLAQDRARRAADRTVHDAWADYVPYLNLIAYPFYQNPPTLTLPQTGWQAELVLTVPIYDGGLRYGQEHERKALANEARLAAEETLRQARSDVRVAFEEMQRADVALDQASQSAAFAKRALELANLAYKAGATTNLEVIDAERSARDAADQAAIAEDAARQARLDLLAASGRFP
jgi:outer membrane protein TolC